MLSPNNNAHPSSTQPNFAHSSPVHWEHRGRSVNHEAAEQARWQQVSRALGWSASQSAGFEEPVPGEGGNNG